VKPWLPAAILGIALLLAAAACGGSGKPSPSPSSSPVASPSAGDGNHVSISDLPIKIVVSLPLFADFARQMGGENVEVKSIVPDEVDPHTFVPGDDAREMVQEADLVFLNGLGLESRELLDFVEANRKELALVVQFANNVPSPSVDQSGRERPVYASEQGDNPHLWLDPSLAKVYPETIADSLIIVDGVHTDFYNENYYTYRDGLLALDEEIRTALGAIANGQRNLATYHDSFIHFAARYQMDVVGFATADPALAPDAGTIEVLRKAAASAGVKAVFSEVGFDEEPMTTVAEELDVPVCRLYSDVLDSDVTSYVKMMRSDVAELERCLR
jgi:zinc/manganese transport system substrate-binding protein